MLRNDTDKYKKRYSNTSIRFVSHESQSSWREKSVNNQHKLVSTMRSQKITHPKVQSLERSKIKKQNSQSRLSMNKHLTGNNLVYQQIILKNKLTTEPKTQINSKFPLTTFYSATIDPKKVNSKFSAFQYDLLHSQNSKQQLQKVTAKKRNKYNGQQPQSLFLDKNMYFKTKLENESDDVNKQKSESLQNMKINDLFFCTECLLYVFKIQLKYHFPVCQKKLFIKSLSASQKINVGWEKLRILVQLAEHTQTKTQKIKSLMQKYKYQWQSIGRSLLFGQDEDEQNNPSYYLLEDIDKAMELTYNKLLRNVKNSTANCMLVNC